MSQSSTKRPRPLRVRQDGVAAVEAAIILPILVLFPTFPIFYTRCFWHYTAAQKSAQDAARSLASVPVLEMRSRPLAKEASAIALEIAKKEIAALFAGSTIGNPQIYCDDVLCGSVPGKAPGTVHVFLNFGMIDTFFGAVDTGRYGLQITADVKMRYVGR